MMHHTPALHACKSNGHATKPFAPFLLPPLPPRDSSLNASRRSMMYAFSSRNLHMADQSRHAESARYLYSMHAVKVA